ncbi:hypothetical protein [Pseudomonas sp. zjy_14]|uniref:hypothetical protein n=1 Tax=Pseudomonas sp. zjy_14 TaxID=3367264 RepID=UPI00370A1F7E
MAPSIPMAPLVTLQGEQAALVSNAREQAMEIHVEVGEPVHRDRRRQGQANPEVVGVTGHPIKNNSEGTNQAVSTIVEAIIDPSLAKSLREIGIERNSM